MPNADILMLILGALAFVFIIEAVLKRQSKQPQILIFMGGPGAGKGTQASRLSKVLKIPRPSAGNLLRHAATANDALALEIKSCIDKGSFVPDELIHRLLTQEPMQSKYDNGFILDGAPRTLKQAELLDQLFEERKTPITAVINLDVGDTDLLLERISGRRTCSNGQCGASYHVKYLPPQVHDICDTCKSPLAQRADDTPEVLEERIERHNQRVAPLLAYYDEQLLLHSIDGSGNIDGIFHDILDAIGADE